MTDFIGSATMAPFGKLTNAELDASALADERRHERKRSSSLPFRTISEIGSMSGSRSWLIKGILARGETSAWVGPPGSLKSALLASVAISVSGGFAWFGRPNKGRAAVCYLALERADLVGRRLQAHNIRDNIDDLPI